MSTQKFLSITLRRLSLEKSNNIVSFTKGRLSIKIDNIIHTFDVDLKEREKVLKFIKEVGNNNLSLESLKNNYGFTQLENEKGFGKVSRGVYKAKSVIGEKFTPKKSRKVTERILKR